MGIGKFFGMNNYSTPGKGVTKEDVKNEKPFKKFFRIFFQNIGKFVQLNLITFTCSIPLVTATFAYAGLSRVTRDFIWEKNPFPFSDFFSTMKKNFKQLLAITLINIVAFLFMGSAAAVYILNFLNIGAKYHIPQQSGLIYDVGFILLLSMFALFVMINFYTAQIAFTFDLKLKQIYKNSLILTIAGLKKTFTAFVIVAAIIALNVFLILNGYYVLISTLCILISLAFCNYVIEFFTLQVIQEFMIDPYNRMNHSAENEEADSEKLFDDEIVDKDNV